MTKVMSENTKEKVRDFFAEEFEHSGIEISDLMMDYFVDGIEAMFNSLASLRAHLMGS
jgi:hypothetical protein